MEDYGKARWVNVCVIIAMEVLGFCVVVRKCKCMVVHEILV